MGHSQKGPQKKVIDVVEFQKLEGKNFREKALSEDSASKLFKMLRSIQVRDSRRVRKNNKKILVRYTIVKI